MHHKQLMMHEISECDGGACPEHMEWVSRGSCSGRPTTRLFLATFAPAHCFNRGKGFPR
jgi:hypothetical protein